MKNKNGSYTLEVSIDGGASYSTLAAGGIINTTSVTSIDYEQTTLSDWYNNMVSSFGVSKAYVDEKNSSADAITADAIKYATEYLGEWKGGITMNEAVSMINLWKNRKIEKERARLSKEVDELYNNHPYFEDINDILANTQDSVMATIDAHLEDFKDQEAIVKEYEIFADRLAGVFKCFNDLTPANVILKEKELREASEETIKDIREKAEAAEATCNICKSKEEYMETLEKYGIIKRGTLNV